MTYSGLFVRDNLGQTPTSGQNGWSGSPDIILYGLTPPPDPNIFVNNYNTDYGSTVYMQQANYVYLRALNTTAGATTGQAWFYYTESDLMLWPGNWQSADIIVDGLAMNNQPIVSTTSNQVCVTGAFVWTPPPFSSGHSSGDHYCTISWMENPPLQPPPWTPLSSIPNFTTCDQLANFVCSNSNMGWRNTTDVSQAGPTWQQTTSITGPSAGGQFQVGIQCSNMPNNGGTVGYVIPGGPGGNPPAVIAQNIPIWDPNAAPMTTVTWPPGYTSSITVSYTQGSGSAPQPGAAIAAAVTLPSSQLNSESLRRARIHQPWRFLTVRMMDEQGAYLGVDQAAIIFGANPYQF